MGVFDAFRKKEERNAEQYLTNTFKLLNGYCPIYSGIAQGLYEMGLTRTCIDKIATQCSKLNPVMKANKNYRDIQFLLENKPNRLMTTQQFLYRLVTILLVENNAYIVPIYKNMLGREIIGLYPVRASGSRITTVNNTDYLVYEVEGKKYSIEYDRVGHLRRHYYKKEYYGESNNAINSTMELIDIQEKGIKEGVKSSAMIRFLAKLGVVQKPEDIVKEQNRLKNEQLSVENNGGVLIFDQKYSDVQKVDSKPFIVDKENMDLIKNNVFDYFHISEAILQNTANEDQWNLFYEDVIEPIALQISQVLTNMIIKKDDIRKGLEIVLESTRLQFVSNNTKLNVATQLFDRGILMTNQVMDIFNLPHVEDGDRRYIRREYANVTEINSVADTIVSEEVGNEETGNSQIGEQEGNSNQDTQD